MGYWEIPKIWDGATCFILGGGPSLLNIQMWKLSEKNVVAVNNAYLKCPWATAVYFQDCKWYHEPIADDTIVTHQQELRKFKGYKVTTCIQSEEPDGSIQVVERGGRHGLSPSRTQINGNNSGYGAIDLAIKFGATRIILLGFDMKIVGGRHNYHSGHRRAVGAGVYKDQFLPAFGTMAKAIKKLELGVEIINCTQDSALDYFKTGLLEDYL